MNLFFNEKIWTIPEFFKNKDIFLTGGSGFIGRVLIEKLLRSCPDIGNIYVLLREKRGKSPQDRVKDLTNVPLFDLLKKQNGQAVNKIIPLNGDTCKLRLGLSDEDRNTIIKNVSIVFHVAASVRFDDPLKKAILSNVRSTVEIIQLAKDLKHPAVFAHVSTAYCNSDKKIIEEKLYPAHAHWRSAIRLAEEMDDHTMEILTEKYINPLPNTYTFTKSLAEHVVNDLCEGEIPAIIVRPTIVFSTLKEPILGWIDNFNGPFGMAMSTGMGITRIIYGHSEVINDYVFVDNVTKSLIIAVWRKYLSRDRNSEISIYNCSSDMSYPVEMYSSFSEIFKDLPLEKKIWATSDSKYLITKCYYFFFINELLFHMLPAIFIDGVLKLLGKKTFLTRIQRKVYIANMSLFYFMSNSWEFKRENYLSLEDKLLQDDLEAFSFRLPRLNEQETREIITECVRGIKKYLLNESLVISRKTFLIDQGIRILHQTLRSLALGWVLYIVFWKYDIITYLSQNIYIYFCNL